MRLIEEIVGESSDYLVEPDGGLLRIYSRVAASHPFNLLNIRLDNYHVQDVDLFEAEDRLRWAIRFTLDPEKYKNGYGGGYGHGAGDVLEIGKFTLSGDNLTIRDVLNRIALAQGNALWVAVIRNDDLNATEPFWKGQGTDDKEGRGRSVTSGWHFYPLAEISELAREQVAIDVMIEGMLDARMSTIPVILENGLSTNAGARGISSSAGYSISYSAQVEKVEKESVTLSINLAVRWKGETRRKLEEKIKVTKGEVTELAPDRGIRIKAYMEPRGENVDGR